MAAQLGFWIAVFIRFIDASVVLLLLMLHLSRAFFFGSRTNVFLSGKAEMAVETRHVFLDTETMTDL